jgi:hypothetical protein
VAIALLKFWVLVMRGCHSFLISGFMGSLFAEKFQNFDYKSQTAIRSFRNRIECLCLFSKKKMPRSEKMHLIQSVCFVYFFYLSLLFFCSIYQKNLRPESLVSVSRRLCIIMIPRLRVVVGMFFLDSRSTLMHNVLFISSPPVSY